MAVPELDLAALAGTPAEAAVGDAPLGPARREHVAAISNPSYPIRKPIAVVIGADNKARPDVEHPPGHPLLRGTLAGGFQTAVQFSVSAGGRAHSCRYFLCFPDLFGRDRRERGALVTAG